VSDFRFRAAAALELRIRQENDAATALAVATAALRAAEAQVRTAEVARDAARQEQTLVERRGSDISTLAWHRNWLVRLGVAIEMARREVEVRAIPVSQAETRWREARKRRLALDRMRARAWRRHVQDEQRRELKAIDELARLRFVFQDIGHDDSTR
jgi:flagellar export protein FliJ